MSTIKRAQFIACEECGSKKHLIMDDYGLYCKKCKRSIESETLLDLGRYYGPQEEED
jgi:hypothetical protein